MIYLLLFYSVATFLESGSQDTFIVLVFQFETVDDINPHIGQT